MKFKSVFEIIGPVMIGPSSSHTAGAVRIGQIARKIFGKEPKEVEIHFYGSFAKTYKGHATDVAVVGGILDYATDDGRVRESLSIAESKGIKLEFFEEEVRVDHPNTLRLILKDDKSTMELVGISIGGGAIQITELDGFPLTLSGENPTMLILHKDTYGTIAAVAGAFTEYRVNIGHMEVSRIKKGHTAIMIIETDQTTPDNLVADIASQPNIMKTIVLNR